ncbi:MAG: glutamate formimidoyltransferase [Candidatus Bipolaricaulia bacterium]
MTKLLESVPNYSVGRDDEVIDKIVEPFKNHADVKLLDYSADPDHNRLVVTNVGSPEGLFTTTLETIGIAIELIDMNEHAGEHPRMGAVDVIPFTPLKNVTMDEAVELAKRLGGAAAEEYDLPIFLYEEAATRPERENLETIRKGEYENFPKKIDREDWKPDFGPDKVHPTAGVTAVGARKPLVAFNVNLKTDDLGIANEIARKVRHSSGGLRYCKAMGVDLEKDGFVQVSMNMTDYTQTSLHQVFELIRTEADRYGVNIAESEIIGLVPGDALMNAAEHYLRINDFSSDQVIENRLLEDL